MIMKQSYLKLILSSLLIITGCQTLPQPDEKESYITAVVDGVRYAAASNVWEFEYYTRPARHYWGLATLFPNGRPILMSNACLLSNDKVRIYFSMLGRGDGIVLGEKFFYSNGEGTCLEEYGVSSHVTVTAPDGNYLEKVSGWVQLDSISNSRAYGQFEFEGKDGEKTISLTEGFFRFVCHAQL